MYENIDGFNFKAGNTYVLQVRKETILNPPMDSSNMKFTLVKEISRTFDSKTCIDGLYNDGCNTCSSNNGLTACTLMACAEQATPYCTKSPSVVVGDDEDIY